MSWNSSYYPGYDFYNSSYPSQTLPSTNSYFDSFVSSHAGLPTGFVVMFVIFGIFVVVGISSAIVRGCGGCSHSDSNYQWSASRPPPVRIISAPGVNNSYPNHVIDVSSHSSYVQMASTPQYRLETIPVAVAIPSAPTASTSDDAATIVVPQLGFTRALRSADQPPKPVIAIGSLPVAQDPAIIASRLPFDALTLHVLINKGSYCRVYKGTFRGETVAIKKLLPGTEKDLKHVTGFLGEIKLVATLAHPHIVQYIGVSWDALSEVCVVTEFMEGGDLRGALANFQAINRPQGFDFQKATIALNVAQALVYMHSQQPVVLHRDLKSRNILLDRTQMIAKLTDIGVSRERGDTTMGDTVGSLLWMAPEVMAGERHDDKADVFSFGVVLSELDTHAMPYADVKAQMVSESGRPMPDTALLQRIMTGRVIVSFSEGLRKDVRSLATSCLSLDPHARPNANHVLRELEQIMRIM